MLQKPKNSTASSKIEKTNGSALRKCRSWIESFVEASAGLESPELFRKWAAISTIAAAVEQRVHVISGNEKLHPNIYCFLVGHPGVGKTRSIRAAKKYYLELPDPRNAPTSMSASSMIDAVAKSKRNVVIANGTGMDQLEYNSLYITADELSAFMHKYDDEAIGVMSDFYDPQPYGQTRRGNDLNIKIKSPQLNIICGTTPSNLMKYMPETAWEQGFTSRVIMLFSDERTIGDDFEERDDPGLNPDLIHDLNAISGLVGRFEVTAEYRNAVNNWRQAGEPDVPSHPKLIHYATRRRVHLYKLSMVSAIDRSDVLLLTVDDFNRALGWLLEAEATMPDIFKAGAGNADARAMDEIYHYVLTLGARGPVPERKIINFAREHIPLHSIERVVAVMERSGMITAVGLDKRTGLKLFKASVPEIDLDGNLLQ
jgi:hypothetical protein